MGNDTLGRAVAAALLRIGAVGFTPNAPVTFRSGLLSPVYVDNRRLIFWPAQWRIVVDGFQTLIAEHGLTFDAIAGIETAGIPHSAALAYTLQAPSVYVRKETKAHGTRSRVEGGSVAGKRVLLIEDLVTTGGSSLSGVAALRADSARVDDCIAIVSYGFTQAADAFARAGVELHTLTTFPIILAEAAASGVLDAATRASVTAWLRDPTGWAQRR